MRRTGRCAQPGALAAQRLLRTGTVIFNIIKVFEFWSRLGLEMFVANRAAWLRPAELSATMVVLALTWRSNRFARTLLLVAIAWDFLGMLSAAGLLVVVGGSRLVGMLSWVNVLVELYAGWLLMQEDSLEWFRRG
jgi:hypothetical protein